MRLFIIGLVFTLSCTTETKEPAQDNDRDTSVTWVYLPIWDEYGHVYQLKRTYDHIPTARDSMEFRNYILQQVEQQVAISKKEITVKDTGKKQAEPISQNTINDSVYRLREGSHNFTLHWISWDRPGRVNILKKGDNIYTVKGEQRSDDTKDYVIIDGTLTVLSATRLEFDGTIQTFVERNHPEPCTKTGKQIFLVTQNRKYWRLQDMQMCNNGITDYVDIYFK